jgi:hypothetical protein
MVTLVQVFLPLLRNDFSFNLPHLNGKYATTTKQIVNTNYFYYKIGIMGTKFSFELHQLKGRYEIGQNTHSKEYRDSPTITLRRLLF